MNRYPLNQNYDFSRDTRSPSEQQKSRQPQEKLQQARQYWQPQRKKNFDRLAESDYGHKLRSSNNLQRDNGSRGNVTRSYGISGFAGSPDHYDTLKSSNPNAGVQQNQDRTSGYEGPRWW